MLKGKILITGGSGFLARGIYRRARREGWPCSFTCYSRHEDSQYQASLKYPEIHYVLGDICDLEHLTAVMMGHDLVIHAAALKRIPEGEFSAAEVVRVNLDGARNVIKAARAAGISKVVGISTDKAVLPVNIYGMTKAVMERLFSEAALQYAAPAFICVRYGNVVASTGSVIPLFERQMKELGHCLVTNPKMMRFWMSVDEAIDLILLALAKARPGSIAIPLVKAMTLEDVVKAVASQFMPREVAHAEPPMEIIGERPGEKKHESLIHYEESVRVVRHHDPSYFELLPVGNRVGEEPFTLASHSPHYWMEPQAMRALIEDAETL